MRTTLDLDDNLVRAVKKAAAETATTMTAVIEDALRERLTRRQAPRQKFEFRWVTVKGKPRPGVDIDDRDSLYDAMEGRR